MNAQVDLTKLSVEQLNAVVNEALRLKREKAEGVPTTDPQVVKLAGEVQALTSKLGIDAAKVIAAIGRNLKPAIQFRAYDPNKPRKPRAKKK